MLPESSHTSNEWLHILSDCKDPQTFQNAAEDTLYDFPDGSKVWKLYYKSLESQNVDKKVLNQAWLDRISVPSIDIDELSESYSSFVSSHYPKDDYVDIMVKASALINASKKISNKLMKFEIDIQKEPSNPKIWLRYIQSCYRMKKSKLRDNILYGIFKRAMFNKGEEWFEIWSRYNRFNTNLDKPKFHYLLAKAMPNSAKAFRLMIRNYSKDIQHLAESNKALETFQITGDEVGPALEEVIWRLNNSPSIDIDITAHLCEKVYDWAVESNLHDICRLAIQTTRKVECIPMLEKLIDRYLSTDKIIDDDWLYCLDITIGFVSDELIMKLFDQCALVLDKFEKPSTVYSRWSVYRNIYLKDNGDYAIEGKYKEMSKKRKHEEEPVPPSKKPRTDLEMAVSEGRETYVTNLDFSTTIEELEKVFSTVGDIETMKFPLRRNYGINGKYNDGFGYVSYKSQKSATDAINTLDGKIIKDRKIRVMLAEAKKVHVRNGRPNNRRNSGFDRKRTIVIKNASDLESKQLQEMLTEVGKIEKQNFKRGMLIVEYSSQKESGIAELKLQGKEIGSNEHIELGTVSDLR